MSEPEPHEKVVDLSRPMEASGACSLSVPDDTKRMLDLSREMVAGGACSLRVLNVINLVHNRQLGELQDDGCLAGQPNQPYQAIEGIDTMPFGQLVVLPLSETEQTTRIAYRYGYTGHMAELLQLTERDADKPSEPLDCSYAVFVPAMDSELDIDYSVITTKADEYLPTSLEQTLQHAPLTNAEVLDQLISVLNKEQGSGEAFAKMIKLDELIAAYGLNQETRAFPEHNLPPEHSDPLARQIGRLLTWSQLDEREAAVKYTKKLGDNTSITAEISADKAVRTSIRHHDLGKSGRSVDIGTLRVRGEDLIADDPAHEAYARKIAEETLSVPEITVDTELQQEVAEIARRNTDPNVINHQIKYAINEYRELAEKPNGVIDIGTLDLRHSEPGRILHGLHDVRAKVIGHDELDVLNNSRGLYECYVFGAREAFAGLLSGNESDTTLRGCITEGVSKAFDGAKARECMAVGGQEAFVNASTKRCLTQDTTEAFMNGDHVSSWAVGGQEAFMGVAVTKKCFAQDTDIAFSSYGSIFNRQGTHVGSQAVNVRRAFNSVHLVRDCIAEHCRSAFVGIDYIEGVNESRNPRLFGFSFNPLDRLVNRGNTKLTGRIIGKGAAKLKGKYRRSKND